LRHAIRTSSTPCTCGTAAGYGYPLVGGTLRASLPFLAVIVGGHEHSVTDLRPEVAVDAGTHRRASRLHRVAEAWEDEHGEPQVDLGEDYQRRVRQAMERLHQVGPPGDLAAPLAVRWANEAGFAPTVAAVQAVLNGDDAVAEDLFFELLEVLGLPDLASTEA
jgi:hypothetical protein